MNTVLPFYRTCLVCLAALFLLQFPVMALAQLASGAQYRGADGIQHDYLIDNGKGEPIQIGDHSNIGGTPFLQYDWKFAVMTLADGRSLTDSLVNYSLYNDQLYFKRDDKIYLLRYPVKEFSIERSGRNNNKPVFHFQNGFPGVDKNDSTTFYEVLFVSEKLQLLKWEHKRIREVYNYGGAYESDYMPVYEYFAFYPNEKRMISLGSKPNIKRLVKDLPEYENKIDTYSALNKDNLRKEEDLVSLFSALCVAKQ